MGEIERSQTADMEVFETSQLEFPDSNKEKRTKSEDVRGVEYKLDSETGGDDTKIIMTNETEAKSDVKKDIIQVVGVDAEAFHISQVEEINPGANNENEDESKVIYNNIIDKELNISDQINEK